MHWPGHKLPAKHARQHQSILERTIENLHKKLQGPWIHDKPVYSSSQPTLGQYHNKNSATCSQPIYAALEYYSIRPHAPCHFHPEACLNGPSWHDTFEPELARLCCSHPAATRVNSQWNKRIQVCTAHLVAHRFTTTWRKSKRCGYIVQIRQMPIHPTMHQNGLAGLSQNSNHTHHLQSSKACQQPYLAFKALQAGN
jgi:hypothetical protein